MPKLYNPIRVGDLRNFISGYSHLVIIEPEYNNNYNKVWNDISWTVYGKKPAWSSIADEFDFRNSKTPFDTIPEKYLSRYCSIGCGVAPNQKLTDKAMLRFGADEEGFIPEENDIDKEFYPVIIIYLEAKDYTPEKNRSYYESFMKELD